MKPEINKCVELIQILLYLSSEQEKTKQVLSNTTYCTAIEKYFSSYRNHKAVLLTRNMINEEYFFHIRPLRAILALDEIANEPTDGKNEWALSVKQFIKDTDFDTFFESQTEYYNWILNNINSCDFNMWTDYIETYFKQKPDAFKLIICPFAGNYGFTIDNAQGHTAYTVRCMPYYDESGNAEWLFDFFAKGVAHEYAHCFVNPIVESNTEILKKHRAFFEQHENIPASYNVDYAVMNEYWVRAFSIRFMEHNRSVFPQFDIHAEYERQRESFVFIDKFVELLKNYEKTDMTFSEYYFLIIDEIDSFTK